MFGGEDSDEEQSNNIVNFDGEREEQGCTSTLKLTWSDQGSSWA